MDFTAFRRALSEDNVPPVLVFHGDEPYLARRGVKLLKSAVLSDGSEPFDFASLSGRTVDAETIVAHAATVPMLSERRLTVVFEFDRLGPSDKGKLLSYARSPAAGSCLALVSLSRIPGKIKFERDLLAAAEEVLCDPLTGDTLVSAVRTMADERGKAIGDEALGVLLDWTGRELHPIANELDKLSCYVGDRREIGLQDVEQVVGAKASGIKDLALAVASQDGPAALDLLGELSRGGLDAARLVSQLFGHWMMLWRTRVERGSGAQRGRSLPGQPGASALRELARRRTSREYAEGVERFYRADLDIRRGLPALPIVGLLIYELCRGRGSSA